MSRNARATWCLGVLCAVICGVGPLPVASQARARPVPGIFGIYKQPRPGRDSIRVTQRPDGKIAVAIKLYYANGHTCQLNKNGDWREDHVAIVAEGLDAGQSCRLSAFFDNGRILLKDEGFQCTPVYCGTRGKLDNVSLPKFNPNRK